MLFFPAGRFICLIAAHPTNTFSELTLKVLLSAAYAQGSLKVGLGVKNSDALDTTISDLMQSIVDNRDLSTLDKGVLKNIEWVDEDYVILRYAE